MVSPPWPNYRYHEKRPPSQDNPKYNFRKNFWTDRHFNLRMDFWGPVHPYRTFTDHLIKPLVISIWNMYFYPSLVYGKLRLRNRAKFRSDSFDITTLPEPWLFSIYLYLGIEDSLAKSSVPHYFITPQYVVWHDSIENSYIPAWVITLMR
jgi:hypothetical protein